MVEDHQILNAAPEKQLSGPDQIRFIMALKRATIVEFTREDWSSLAGAMGKAHMIHFVPWDLDWIMTSLGMTSWTRDVVTVVLDETGITFNGYFDGDDMNVGQVNLNMRTWNWDA